MAAAATTARTRAVAWVDTGAIERNCALLRARLGDAQLCAVVKADGYGHGALVSAQAALAGGAAWLAVATANEAEELREEGIDARVLVMGALTSSELETALAADADVVAWTEAFVELARSIARGSGQEARLHVKLDTGMGRLGTKDPVAALDLLSRINGADFVAATGFMTHFATADEPDGAFLDAQLGRFAPAAAEARGRVPGLVVHAANSAATLREPAAHFDMARCGIAIYGLSPFQRDPAEARLDPALALESYVAAVKHVAPGDSVGYGRSWFAEQDTHVAVVPIGYGDGYRRGLSNSGDVLIGGRRYPIVGTISMDNLTVDVGEPGRVQVGDPVTLIGGEGKERVLAEDVAAKLGTINYEVTTGLTARVPRVLRASK
jgi:alanine racemase